MLAYVLLGYLIGQILTLEGLRLERFLYVGCILTLSLVLSLLPILFILSVIHAFQLLNSPTVIIAIAIVYASGLMNIVHITNHPTQYSYDE
jgi:hypothetical protein